MRWFILVAASVETLFWAAVAFRGDLLPRPLDPAGFHFFFIFFVLPAASLGMWGHGLTFGCRPGIDHRLRLRIDGARGLHRKLAWPVADRLGQFSPLPTTGDRGRGSVDCSGHEPLYPTC